jgi:hypothetical protein
MQDQLHVLLFDCRILLISSSSRNGHLVLKKIMLTASQMRERMQVADQEQQLMTAFHAGGQGEIEAMPEKNSQVPVPRLNKSKVHIAITLDLIVANFKISMTIFFSKCIQIKTFHLEDFLRSLGRHINPVKYRSCSPYQADFCHTDIVC